MGINKRDEGKKVNSNINVTPMVDVMLVLLIIFMVITPMLNNKVNVDLPKADAAVVMEDANKEDAITVAVTRDGRTFLGGDQVTLDDLGPKIAAKLENKPGSSPTSGTRPRSATGAACSGMAPIWPTA
jgi:biopolymer transport protein TolR